MRQPPFISRRIPCTHFYQRLSRSQGHIAAGRIRPIEKSSNGLIGVSNPRPQSLEHSASTNYATASPVSSCVRPKVNCSENDPIHWGMFWATPRFSRPFLLSGNPLQPANHIKIGIILKIDGRNPERHIKWYNHDNWQFVFVQSVSLTEWKYSRREIIFPYLKTIIAYCDRLTVLRNRRVRISALLCNDFPNTRCFRCGRRVRNWNFLSNQLVAMEDKRWDKLCYFLSGYFHGNVYCWLLCFLSNEVVAMEYTTMREVNTRIVS
jgi:hypothetical protein